MFFTKETLKISVYSFEKEKERKFRVLMFQLSASTL
jgi:hypothetical protein